jgi:CTP synthase (UTP-ammonia lyase)
MTTVVIVGDHMSHAETHLATEQALRDSAGYLGLDLEMIWMATQTITPAAAPHLAGVDAMVVSPGSYASPEGAVAAIEIARVHDIPLIGTCGGMQHLVLELARNVVGAAGAAHAEADPDADDLWVTSLACSLAGQTGEVTVAAGTLVADVYGSTTTTEAYYCSFGINSERLADLVRAGLVVSGTDHDGEPRIVELPGHPFFVGTLFVPQVRSSRDRPHPLVTALLAAAAERS